jgi:putative ABC transport system permease protein
MSPQSRRISPFLTVFGRLQPGVSLDQASAELAVIQHRYAASYPAMLDAKTKGPVRARLWKDELVSRAGSILWMLFGAVAFVLLIACANVASLLLARATWRTREFAVRSALGASRARLIGQMLVESVLLSILGGAFGILFAGWILRAVSHTNVLDLPRAAGIHSDSIVLGFTAMLSVGTGILFGLAPSLRASRLDLMCVLRTGSEAVGGSMQKLRVGLTAGGVLVIGQVTLSIVLLIGASLLIESVMYLREIKPGFNPERLLTTQITLPPLRYNSDRKRMEFLKNSYAVWNQYPAFKAPQQR